MTEQQIRDLGPAFARSLDSFRGCFADHRAVEHLRASCRGRLSDLPRKSVEPIALASGTAVRTLPAFLRDHAGVRDRLPRRPAAGRGGAPDPVGTVGIVDETSAAKKGTKTPGVQRQYRGCAGEVGNGVVTVHLAAARGRLKALLDADLFPPESWDADRERCAAAGIPGDVIYRPKWRTALDRVRRAVANGLHLDRVGFDGGYGDKPGFRAGPGEAGRTYAGEVPRDRPTADGPAERVAAADPRFTARRWRLVRVPRRSEPDGAWEVRAARVRLRWDERPTAGEYGPIVARSRRTGEVKYLAPNAGAEVPVARVVQAAFARRDVEHAFRAAKSEAGMTHYEGRSHIGLMRHLVRCRVVVGFVALRADGLRGKARR